jgi:type I restriction enzyme S subunit
LGLIRRLTVPIPPIEEQRAISSFLGAIQEAKEARLRELALERERKGALIDLFFTKLPATGANIIELGRLISFGPQNGIYKPLEDYGAGTLIIRIDDFDEEGRLNVPSIQRVRLPRRDAEIYGLVESDLLINRVNSLSHLAKALLVRRLLEPTVFESNMMRLRLDESKVIPAYVAYFLLAENAKSFLRGRAKRAIAQSSVNQGDVRALPVPLLSLPRQTEIVSVLSACDSKLQSLEQEIVLLNELFLVLLEELMCGRVSGVPLAEQSL